MQDSYREIFLSESQEYLSNMSKCLVKLEEEPSDQDSVNEIFRCLHTLKGMSATMGFEKLAQLSHQMEDLLDELRSKRRKVTPLAIDNLFEGVDLLEQLVKEIKLNQESTLDISVYLKDLKKIFSAPDEAPIDQRQPRLEFSSDELSRLSEAKAEGLNLYRIAVALSKECAMKEARAFLLMTNLKQIGTVMKTFPPADDLKAGRFGLSFTLILATHETQEVVREELLHTSDVDEAEVAVMELKGQQAQRTTAAPSYVKKIQSMRIPVKRLDKIMNLMGELAIAKIQLLQFSQSARLDTLDKIAFAVDRLTSSLQDEIMQTRLLPIAYILDTFPRLVRDLSRKQDKEIDLEIIGSDIELDRVVLDEIGDPLVHLVRNAVDHGIESPGERKELKKNPRGKILIKVLRQKGQISIEVVDDGRGVDFQLVSRLALKKALITAEEAARIDDNKLLEILTLPGFSTSQEITDVSGRGVGLDVVKAKSEALGGRLDFETKLGFGSRFVLTLPLTLAIIKAMLVKVAGEIFAVPLMSIRETVILKEDEFKIIQNYEVIRVRDEIIPVIRLDRELGIPDKSLKSKDSRVCLVIVEYGSQSLALTVSQVIGEQDIVVKPLGSLVKKTKGIAGATILGDGRVALILDIMSLK